MQGRTQEGISLLEESANFLNDYNLFRGHLWWHLAIFKYSSRAFDEVLELLDREIYPTSSSFYLDIQNGASLLLRLEAQGVSVGMERWERLSSRFVANGSPKTQSGFTTVHQVLAFAAYRTRFCRRRNDQLCERAGSVWFTASPVGGSDFRSSCRWFPRASSACSRFAVVVATRVWPAWSQPCTARSLSTHDDLSRNATRRLAANPATFERTQHRSILEPSKFGSTRRACAAN